MRALFIILFSGVLLSLSASANLASDIPRQIPSDKNILSLTLNSLKQYIVDLKERSVLVYEDEDSCKNFHVRESYQTASTIIITFCSSQELLGDIAKEVLFISVNGQMSANFSYTRAGENVNLESRANLLNARFSVCQEGQECTFYSSAAALSINTIINENFSRVYLRLGVEAFSMSVLEQKKTTILSREFSVDCANCINAPTITAAVKKSDISWVGNEISYYSSNQMGKIKPSAFNRILSRMVLRVINSSGRGLMSTLYDSYNLPNFSAENKAILR